MVSKRKCHTLYIVNDMSSPQYKTNSCSILDIIVRKSVHVFKQFTSKNQPLLISWETFLVLDLGLDCCNGVIGLNFQSDGLA